MNELFNHTFQLGHHTLTVFEIFEATLVVVLARIALGLARRALGKSTWLSAMDAGKQFIFRRLVSSGIWFVAALVALSALGVDLTALWAGSAALLVGVGIGLQGFFNDVVSGFVLLFEGGIAVGHILEVEGEIVRVKRIDLRSTRVETVSGEWIVLPNSKVSGEAVVNLSQGGTAVRISVEVGVAYGSDVEQVTALLKEAVMEQPETKDKPPVAVFFQRLWRLLAGLFRDGMDRRPMEQDGHPEPHPHGHRCQVPRARRDHSFPSARRSPVSPHPGSVTFRTRSGGWPECAC